MRIFWGHEKQERYEILLGIREVRDRITRLERQQEKLMATIAELTAAETAVGTSVTSLTTAVDALIAKLGTTITPAELDPVLTGLTGLSTLVDALTAKVKTAAGI